MKAGSRAVRTAAVWVGLFLVLGCGGGGGSKDNPDTIVRLLVPGMEVTQGIQYYRSDQHLVDFFGADNSVPLVARKSAWARVYVRSHLAASIPDVTGMLTVEQREGGIVWTHVADLYPQAPGHVDAVLSPDYATERGDVTRTLNFFVPAGYLCGTVRLTAHLEAPGGYTAQASQIVDVRLYQRLRIRGVMIAYDDGGAPPVQLPEPTLAELQQIATWAVDVYPVSNDASFGIAGSFTHDKTVVGNTNPGVGCGDLLNWGGLDARYYQVRAADGDLPGFIYYGLLAAGLPGADSAGCGGPAAVYGGAGEGVPAGLDGTFELTAETTLAHESGHHLGRQHAPGKTPDPDPSYPAYASILPGVTYPAGSIGEYGLDVDTGTIYPPDTFADFMSYQPRRWISPYGWNSFLYHPRLSPTVVCEDDPLIPDPPVEIPDWEFDDLPDPWPDPWQFTDVIDVIAVVGGGGPPDVLGVTRASVASMPEGEVTTFAAELLDAGGTPITTAPFVIARAHGSPQTQSILGDLVLLHARLPDLAPGAALRVLDDGTEVWRRSAPTAPPSIDAFDADVSGDRRLVASWMVTAPDPGALTCWLRWRLDATDPWHGLAVGLTGNTADVDLAAVPGGSVQVELVVHDGFHSVASAPVALLLPDRPLSVAIVSPHADQGVRADFPLRLFAVAAGDPAGPVAADAFTWSIDGTEVGHGRELLVTAPAAGDHRVSVRFDHGGATATDEGSFRTAPPEGIR